MDFLLLERDHPTRVVLGQFFDMLSIQCHHVNDVEEAICYLRKYKPDCVILDITLDYTYSVAVIEECMKLYKGTLPIIVLSAIRDIENVVGNLPVSKLLKKPFDLEDLEMEIQKLPRFKKFDE